MEGSPGYQLTDSESDFEGFPDQPRNNGFHLSDSESDFEGFDDESAQDSFDDSDLEQERERAAQGAAADQAPLNYDPEGVETDWKASNFQPVVVHPFRGHADSGPKLPPDFDVASGPLEYFQLFFPDSLLLEIVQNTNRYADWYRRKKRNIHPDWDDRLWPESGEHDTNLEEIKAYFGLLILFGVNPMPQYKDYWASNIFIGNEGVKNTMSVKRYEKITQYFHVADRDAEPAHGRPGYDKLFKVRPVIEQVQKQSYALYKPKEHQAIDEGIWRLLHKDLNFT